MSSSRNVRAFTLRELLVLIAVIGLLLSLLLPLVNSRQGPNYRSICHNNMRQLALATVNYDSNRLHYPGYRDSIAAPDGTRLARPLVYMILPQLERTDVHEVFNAENHPHDGVPDFHLAVLTCPSAGPAKGSASSFIANAGMPDWPSAEAPPDWQANGVFQDLFPWPAQVHGQFSNSAYISRHDGLTNTLLFSERLTLGRWNDMAEHEVGFVWHPRLAPGASSTSSPGASTFDAAKYRQAQPSSGHPGVINVAFCDCHVRSIDANIDYRVYAQLMTPWGAKAAYPGLQSGARLDVEEAFRSHALPDEFR